MNGPRIGFCLTDTTGRVLASRGDHASFYGASTVKLGVFLALAERIDTGLLAWDLNLPSLHRFSSRIAGAGEFGFVPGEVDHGMPSVGTPVTLRDLAGRMIAFSSNEATNILAELMGLDAVNAAFARVGAEDAGMDRLIGDYPAREAGFSHDVSPRALAITMAAVVSGRAASPETTAVLLGMLRDQQYPVIADVLGPGRDWGSKSGWVDGIEHDVAFVGPADSGGETLCLAVCTEGYAPDPAKEAIRALAAVLLN